MKLNTIQYNTIQNTIEYNTIQNRIQYRVHANIWINNW
jgi:hypothetical protein